MQLTVSIPGEGDHTVHLKNVTEQNYERIRRLTKDGIDYVESNEDKKMRDTLSDVFLEAINICPEANPSDIWHHILYRTYLKEKNSLSPSDSWARTSGDAFEIAFCKYYNKILGGGRVRLKTQFKDSKETLERLGNKVAGNIGNSKIDIIIEKKGEGRSIGGNGYGIIGVVHGKVSLAERVSDDIPASRILMDEGLFSVLATLDVKSFPPPHGDLVNRGELGTPSNPTDKREYIEEHGDFSACFSYNHRTTPSPKQTPSGARIYSVDLTNNPDAFTQFLRDLQL